MSRIRKSSFFTAVLRCFLPPSEKKLSHLSKCDRQAHPFFSIPASSIEKGREKLRQKEYTKALKIFLACTLEMEQNPWSWHGKGDALQFLGRFTEAEQAYRKATELAPETAIHWGGLANALFGLGNTEEGTKIWKKTKEMDPSLVWMRSN